MRKALLITGAALLALAACKQAADKGAAAPPATAPAASASTAFTADQAFRLAFGAPPPFERAGKIRGSDLEDDTLTYKPGKLVPVGDRMALVSLGTNARDCHACSGALAVHYLKFDGGAWTVAGAWPEIVSGNGFGQPPNWRLRNDLGGGTFIESEAGWSGQGYTCTSVDLIELTPEGAVVRGEGIPLHYDNEGAAETPAQVRRIDGTLARGPDGKLRVTFTGSKTGFVDYEMVGGKLVRTSGGNVIDDC